jgi:hypothetical protein
MTSFLSRRVQEQYAISATLKQSCDAKFVESICCFPPELSNDASSSKNNTSDDLLVNSSNLSPVSDSDSHLLARSDSELDSHLHARDASLPFCPPCGLLRPGCFTSEAVLGAVIPEYCFLKKRCRSIDFIF